MSSRRRALEKNEMKGRLDWSRAPKRGTSPVLAKRKLRESERALKVARAKRERVARALEKTSAPFEKRIEKIQEEMERATKALERESERVVRSIRVAEERLNKARHMELNASVSLQTPTTPEDFEQWLAVVGPKVGLENAGWLYEWNPSSVPKYRALKKNPRVSEGVKVFGATHDKHKLYVAFQGDVIVGYLRVWMPRQKFDSSTALGVVNGALFELKPSYGWDGALVPKRPVEAWTKALRKAYGKKGRGPFGAPKR